MDKQKQNQSQTISKHFIHIGYPKAGSTYLQEWFKAHPQLLMVTRKTQSFILDEDQNFSEENDDDM